MWTISLDINITLIQENATIEETATTEQTATEDTIEEITRYGTTGNETTVVLEMTIQKVPNSSNKFNGNSSICYQSLNNSAFLLLFSGPHFNIKLVYKVEEKIQFSINCK